MKNCAYSKDNFTEKAAIAIFREMNWQTALKGIAKQPLERLKENEIRVVNWFEKEQAKSAVRNIIGDALFYHEGSLFCEDSEIDKRTLVLFDFFKIRYDGKAAA